MQPSPVLTEVTPVHDVQHAIMHPSETAHATSSGSMTPRSYAHTKPLHSQETPSSQDSDSPTFQLSSSEVSQQTHPDSNDLDVSPISSQDHGSSGATTSPIQSKPQRPNPLDLPGPIPYTATSRSPKQEDASPDVLLGQKRTASGQMKRSSITSLDDLKKEQATISTRHSRTSSMLSNGSTGSVMEVRLKAKTGPTVPVDVVKEFACVNLPAQPSSHKDDSEMNVC